MSMTSTQKPFQVKPQYMSAQKIRMSIIDQLSPIKDLTTKSSLQMVRGKSNGGMHSMSNKKLLDSTSFNTTTLNYTQESYKATLPKGMKFNNFEILVDQLRFAACQLEDLKKSFDKLSQQQLNQVIHVIKTAINLSHEIVKENNTLKQSLNTAQSNNGEYDKLKTIMEQLQQKVTVLMSENAKLQKNQIIQKENVNPNIHNKTSRELNYKLEQAELRLLTLQISNDNLNKQLQHQQLDNQNLQQLKETIQTLEIKSQSLLNQKDALQHENELLNLKIINQEKKLNEHSQKSEYIIYIHQLENDIKSLRNDNQSNQITIKSLNNTIQQLMEQISIYQVQEQTNSQKLTQQQNDLQMANSKYQILYQEIIEMRERLQQRQIAEESGKMLSHAEKALFETQIGNLQDKIRDYEQMLLHSEQKCRAIETQLISVSSDDQLKQALDMANKKNQSLEIKLIQLMEQLMLNNRIAQ